MNYQEFLDTLPDESIEPWVSEAALAGKAIKENLSVEPVLFLGSGSAKFACAVGKMGFKTLALEISQEQSRIASERVRENELSTRVIPVWAEYDKLKFDDSTFPLVVAERGLLSIAENPGKILSELSRVLSPGGRIVATFFKKPFSEIPLNPFPSEAEFPAVNLEISERAENDEAVCLVLSKKRQG